jgi:ketosteroid isomerase-like protein
VALSRLSGLRGFLTGNPVFDNMLSGTMANLILLLFAAATLLSAADVQVEKEIFAAMDAYKHAMMAKDRAALEKLFHKDLTYTHSSGLNETKAEAIKAVTEGRTKIENIDLISNSVRVYGNTALVKGKVDFRNNAGGQVSTAHLDVLHVWIKGATGWQLVARQALRLNPQ